MNNFLHNLKTLSLGLSLVCLCSAPALADDIEVFTGAFTSPDAANVLLIVDTSGSMDGTVDFNGIYDSAETYAGSYTAGRYYWVDNSDDEDDVDTDHWFTETAFVCDDAMGDIDQQGYYDDESVGYWDSNDEKWYELSGSGPYTLVECRDDRGLHGDGTSITDVYAVNGSNGPFYDSNPKSSRVKWKNINKVNVYSANYLNFYEATSSGPRRKIEIVQDAAQAVIDNVSGINVGLMRFSSDSSGGMILHEIEDIDTSATDISTAIGTLDADGGTPLAETLYEAHQYFAGDDVVYGLDSVTISGGSYVDTPSVDGSRDGDVYETPITNACQQNFAILLTDGDPTNDTNADNKIDSLPGFAGNSSCNGSDPDTSCLDDMAEYMATVDLNSDLELDQLVRTYTIGFDYEHELLQETADKGQGEFYRADNYDELYTALTTIFAQVNEIDYSFVSPTVSVNTFNRLTHNNQLYFSVYRPSASPSWSGNIKRYALGYDENGLTVVDATGSSAINPDTNAFRSDSKSFWTIGDPDGFDTTAGGFASRLHNTRNVYTDLLTTLPLNHAYNLLHKDNPFITHTHLGVAEANRDSTLEWANGVDSSGNVINNLTDALHSKPIIISYGGTLENPDLTLYYTTNAGYLHALDVNVNTSENLERFAYVPLDLVDNLKDHISNTLGGPKLYGLDGGISGRILNDNGNGFVESGETAMVYMSMRRGGQSVYALNVTDRDAPVRAFQITPATTGFSELGQTWSAPTYAKVKFNGVAKDVIFFGGGYDTNQDDPVPADSDSMGRAIYMIDAADGSLLWWAGHGDDYADDADLPLDAMDYSIPSDLTIIDANSDGYADRIYVGDMGGQLWRVDFDLVNTGASDFASAGVIANLGDEASGSADNRRFYYPPSVSQYSDPQLGNFFALAIGSGHRANPLGDSSNPIEDRFYMIRDKYMFSVPKVDGIPTYTSITESNLLDITNNLNPSTSDLNSHDGWMIDLRNKEKVISKAISVDNRIFFNSYLAGVTGDLTCDPNGGVGSGYAYSVDIGRGLPAQNGIPVDEDGDGTIDIPEIGDEGCEYRCEQTTLPLPPEPLMVFVEPDPDYSDCGGFAEVATVIGTELKDPNICTAPVHTYWVEED